MSTVARAMSELVSAMSSAGLTGRFEAYPVNKAPTPPFYVYTVDDNGEFYSDDTTFARLPRMHALYLRHHRLSQDGNPFL